MKANMIIMSFLLLSKLGQVAYTRSVCSFLTSITACWMCGCCREMADMRVATEKAEAYLHQERGMCTALGDALRFGP